MDFLEEQDEKQAVKICKLKPKVGMWAQCNNEFGDVWHEIATVYLQGKSKYFSKDYSSLRLYCHRKNENPIESFYFSRIRKVVKTLPLDAAIIKCKEGYFSDKMGNWKDLPKRIKFK